SGYGEGRSFLGAAQVMTDSNGNASFSAQVAVAAAGDFVTATTTDANNNTSEFSQCIQVTSGTPPAGTVQFLSANVGVPEYAGSVPIMVVRSGDTSTTATVDYSTSDGTASQMMDYTIASGTLHFAAGEASKS